MLVRQDDRRADVGGGVNCCDHRHADRRYLPRALTSTGLSLTGGLANTETVRDKVHREKNRQVLSVVTIPCCESVANAWRQWQARPERFQACFCNRKSLRRGEEPRARAPAAAVCADGDPGRENGDSLIRQATEVNDAYSEAAPDLLEADLRVAPSHQCFDPLALGVSLRQDLTRCRAAGSDAAGARRIGDRPARAAPASGDGADIGFGRQSDGNTDADRTRRRAAGPPPYPA